LVVSAWEPEHATEGGSLILANSLPHWSSRHEVRVLTVRRSAGRTVTAEGPNGVPVTSFARSGSASVDYVERRIWGLAHREPAHVRWVLRPPLLQATDFSIASGWPDVIHLLGWGTAPLWRNAGDIPTVHMPIDPWLVGLRNRRLPRWRALADAGAESAVRRHERVHYPKLGRVVVVAPHDAQTLAQQVPDARIDVVVNGVEAGPDPDPPSDDPVIAFHGAFEAQANVDAALVLIQEVLPAVRSEVPDARLRLIGRDPPAELRSLQGPSVEVTGAVPDIRADLSRTAVHADPMFSGTGLKNKVLEAMAAGLPVVATPLALSGIGAGEGTSEAATATDIARRLVELLQNRDLRLGEGDAARKRIIRDFSWASSARAIEDLWEQVASP
jgi:glycosyltransferase involved in cell wall biosynthesis